jgi:hypothetical protein
MDDAILDAVRANAHEGLARTNADKEKAVKALLASEKWREMSDGEIANAAGVTRPVLLKLRKVSNQDVMVTSSSAANRATRLGKDYPSRSLNEPEGDRSRRPDLHPKKGRA